MEHLTDDERELLALAMATQCWLPVNPATVVKLLEEISRLRVALAALRGIFTAEPLDRPLYSTREAAEAAKGQVTP